MLEEKSLPAHLASLCEEYLQRTRPMLSEKLYPPCVRFPLMPIAAQPATTDTRDLEVSVEEFRRNSTSRRTAASEKARDLMGRYVGRQMTRKFDGGELSARSECADDVGGDGYAILPEEPAAGQPFTIVIFDAEGCGIPAAITMTHVMAILMHSQNLWPRLPELVKILDAALLSPITMFAGVVNAERTHLDYINASQDAGCETGLVCVARRNGTITRLEGTGPRIGERWDGAIAPDARPGFESAHIALEPDCKLILMTDGIVEASDSCGGEVSESLPRVIRENIRRSASELLSVIWDFANAAPAGEPDDRTVMVVGFSPRS